MAFDYAKIGFAVKAYSRFYRHLIAVQIEFEFLLIHRCGSEQGSVDPIYEPLRKRAVCKYEIIFLLSVVP